MKLFYVTGEPGRYECPRQWHSLKLYAGTHLLCVDWRDSQEEAEFAAREDVLPLPHPIFEATKPLTDEHLKHLSVRYKFDTGATVHDLLKQAALEDPWFRVWVL